MKELLAKVKIYEDDPNELSKILLEATSRLYYLGNEQHQANLDYATNVVAELNKFNEGGKKPSVAEAERRAEVLTEGKVDKIRYERESLQELINAIKTRLRILESEIILQPNN